MKWDIDKVVTRLEPKTCSGFSVGRCMMDVSLMIANEVTPTSEQLRKGYGNIWSVAVGSAGGPKSFYYGQTILAAVQQAERSNHTEAMTMTRLDRIMFDIDTKAKSLTHVSEENDTFEGLIRDLIGGRTDRRFSFDFKGVRHTLTVTDSCVTLVTEERQFEARIVHDPHRKNDVMRWLLEEVEG